MPDLILLVAIKVGARDRSRGRGRAQRRAVDQAAASMQGREGFGPFGGVGRIGEVRELVWLPKRWKSMFGIVKADFLNERLCLEHFSESCTERW